MYPQTNPEKDRPIKRAKDQQERKRMWKPEEDMILKRYVELHGEGNWSAVSHKLGLRRGGKSCRLRWKNYLRPDIVHGAMSEDEEDLIIRMHKLVGNRWSLIAGRLPGRTDNEVKNYWNTYLSKKVSINNQGAKRKPTPSDKELDESHKKRTKTMSSEQTKHGHDHGKSTQEVSPNTMVGVGVRGEISSINPSEEFLTTGDQLLVGPGSDAASPSCGIMGMHFGGDDDGGNPFIIFDQQLEEQFGAALFDHSSCVLFDAFGAPFLI